MIYENKDCISFLKGLPERSVNSIILDPPYYRVVSDEWDKQWANREEYLSWCNEWLQEMERVAKYSCAFWVFGYADQLIRMAPSIRANNFDFKQSITIDKGLRSVAGRTSSSLKMFPTATEHLHFYHYDSKDLIRDLWNAVKAEKGIDRVQDANGLINKATSGGATWACVAGKGKPHEFRTYPTRKDWEALQKHGNLPDYDDYVYKFNLPKGLTDVWNDINFYEVKAADKFHSTQKPIPLMERIVSASTNENDIVLDFFGGSGSTGVACANLNRQYWGCEIDSKYYQASKQRIEESYESK